MLYSSTKHEAFRVTFFGLNLIMILPLWQSNFMELMVMSQCRGKSQSPSLVLWISRDLERVSIFHSIAYDSISSCRSIIQI